MNNYLLLKTCNQQGAQIRIAGTSQIDMLADFDSQYSRKGWKIYIFDSLNETSTDIKKTFR